MCDDHADFLSADELKQANSMKAALATVDAEYKIARQESQQQRDQEVRDLKDQLRRAQQEANVARSQATKYESKLAEQNQQQAQQSFANRIPPPPVNVWEQPAPPAKPVVTPTNFEDEKYPKKPDPRPSDELVPVVLVAVPSAVPPRTFGTTTSSGVSLAQHLLRNKPSSETSPVLTHLSRIATTDSSTISATHVVWILVQEVVTAARAEQSSAMYSQLAWLNTALQVCPEACRSILRAAAVSNETRTESRRKRRPKIRVGNSQAME